MDMFNKETRARYQELKPSPTLRERVLSAVPARRRTPGLGSLGPWIAAACLAALVVAAALPLFGTDQGEPALLFHGDPVGPEPVSVEGEGPLGRELPAPSLYAGPSQSPPSIRLILEADGEAMLTAQGGTLSVQSGEGVTPSQESLTLTSGSRVEWRAADLLPGETAKLVLAMGDWTKTYLLSYQEAGETWTIQEIAIDQKENQNA